LAIGNVPRTRALPILMNEVKIIMDVDHGPDAGEASYTYSLRMRILHLLIGVRSLMFLKEQL
jgi:hypothetical protein